MNSKKLIVLLLIALPFLTFAFVLAYDNLKIHPDLTAAAIELYQKNGGKQLSDKEKALIIEGSIDEDADPRYLNHFYNPTGSGGLDDYEIKTVGGKEVKIHVTGMPTNSWAQNQSGAVTGDYSESTILENYLQKDYRRAYQGVGHMLHLMQDMSVPAHTRNDSHSDGDPYEKWTQTNGVVNLSRSKFVDVSNLSEGFGDLSLFSNNNFFSKDTININKDFQNKIIELKYDGLKIKYVVKSLFGVDYKVCIVDDSSIIPIYRIDDDIKLNLDYWNMLSPKAVGYSAGVIDYFVKKFEEIDKNRKDLSWWQEFKDASKDIGEGLAYGFGDIVGAGSARVQKGWDRGTETVSALAKNWGFFKEATKETTTEVADATIEAAQKTVDATEKTAKKVAVTTSDLTKKAADQSKVLGQKIIKIAVKPVQAATKKPPLKLPSAPIKPVVTITPVEPKPITPAPVIVLPPSGSSTEADASFKKNDDFLLIFSNGTSLPEQARANEVPTGTDLIITPPATTSPTSTDATATTTEPTPTSTAPAHVVISEIYASENNSGSEWVELYNPTDESVDLSGWKLDTQFDNDGDAILPDGSTIDPQGYYLIGDQSSGEWRPDSRNWPKPDFYNGAITLTDYDGWVRLRTASGTIVDAVGWGETSVYEANALSSEEYDRALSFKRRGLIDNVSVLDSDDNQADFAIESDPYPDRHAPTCVEISSEEGVITDGQLTAEQGTYCVTSWLTVAEGDSLMVEPGVIVKFAPNIGLNIEGELSAIGTQEDKVYFTSIYDDIGGKVGGWTKETLQAGEWANLQFTQESTGNFDWTVIRYGGTYGPALARARPGSLYGGGPRLAAFVPAVSNDVAVIYVSAAVVNIVNSVIQSNAEGVEVSSGGTATVANSQFIGNGKGYVNSTDQEQIVTDNFWGASSGPLHDQLNPEGEGDSVTGLVALEPWLSAAPFDFY